VSEASPPKIVVGLGEVLWDMLPAGKMLGGAPANCAYHANAVGGQGVVLSAVGNDPLGHEILKTLEEKGLSTEYVAVLDDHPTGTVTVELSEEGQPTYTIHENVAWDHIPLTPEVLELAQSCAAVCFGSLAQRSTTTRETIRAFLESTSAECLRVFDINIRQATLDQTVLEESLHLATILKLNDEELPYLATVFALHGEVIDQLQQLRAQFNLECIAYTRGANGNILLDATQVVDLPGGEAVEIADTIGAGDTFTAALIINRLHHCDLNTIAQRAHDRARLVCTQPGGMPTL
jgi:fructokinase